MLKINEKTIARNVRIIKNEFLQFIGLRFHPQLNENKALVFVLRKKSKAIVDMFFVFFNIDILWLDENKKIIHLQENAKPFCFYRPKKEAKYIVELRRGMIRRNNIKLDTKLDF